MALIFSIHNNIGWIAFDDPDSKVNILSFEVLKRFNGILDEVATAKRLDALVLISKKKDVFIAGADIKEIENITNSDEGKEKSHLGQKIFNKLEDLDVPTIAMIDGVTLGGGCELALACRYRVATFNEKIKIGLPEVNLGILPGFGGTYRLPRLVGLKQGLKIILSGGSVSSSEAFKIGLVDRLIPQVDWEMALDKFINEIKSLRKRPASFHRKSKGIAGFLDQFWMGQQMLFGASEKAVLKSTKGFYPAPLKALHLIKENFYLRRKAGLEKEASAFGELVTTDVCKNLIKVFYLSEKFKKYLPPGCESLKPQMIRKCGVVGAGVMGGGIAQLFAYRNIDVRLKDIQPDALAKGLKSAYDVFRQASKKRKITPAEMIMKMGKITPTLDFSGFHNVDCVVEAVVEKMDVKKKVFADISAQVNPERLLCTNTSSLSVTEMAKSVKDPRRLVGFHFFNPVHRMPLIEIIQGKETSPQTLTDAFGLARSLGKTAILVKDAPGFLVNRILLAYMNEAARILELGASVEFVDRAMTDFGMPMGPFRLSDEVGLDVGLKVLHILHEGLGEHFQPASILEKTYQKGLLGKKSGKGFYLYGDSKANPVNPEIVSLRSSSEKHSISALECQERMVGLMINEAARCLEEKIVDDASVVDAGMIWGTGFPPFRGGLLRYADQWGISQVVTVLEGLAKQLNAPRFLPCEYLLTLHKEQKRFYER
ncbi:MAG: 3-hydroxyacyl-CoA dehydrogenase NAD-binding domain-containing protein [Candidatus Omnitrophica bacterium]|nr:3-hydroxyacyl-CoA dehydrogenase NAD-binding domain-containing protein [Candidatus Omnitrophota bacterium]